jgi:hypothetical protein
MRRIAGNGRLKKGREFEKREDGEKDGRGIPTLSTSPQSLTNLRKRLFYPIKAYLLHAYYNILTNIL